MTLFDVEELTTYWADHPPVHLSVAAYLGIGAKAPQATAPSQQPTLAAAAAASSPDKPAARSGVMFELPGFAHGDIHDRTLEDPIFDFAEARAREDARYSKLTNG